MASVRRWFLRSGLPDLTIVADNRAEAVFRNIQMQFPSYIPSHCLLDQFAFAHPPSDHPPVGVGVPCAPGNQPESLMQHNRIRTTNHQRMQRLCVNRIWQKRAWFLLPSRHVLPIWILFYRLPVQFVLLYKLTITPNRMTSMCLLSSWLSCPCSPAMRIIWTCDLICFILTNASCAGVAAASINPRSA